MSQLRDLKIGVFAYNFVHRKTQDILVRLFLEKVPVQAVWAADKIKLDIPKPGVRTKIRHTGILPPEQIAASCGFPFFNVFHDREPVLELLDALKPDIGIIAGARILPPEVIDRFRLGIINFHPGLLPESRGLDAMMWSIYNDIPLGVTAHLIDRHVDAGQLLIKKPVSIYSDDSVFDLSERLYETQLDLLMPALRKLAEGAAEDVDLHTAAYNRKMPPELEKETLSMVRSYVQRHSD